MKEKVKELIEIWQKNPDVYLGHGKGYRKMTIDDLVEQICQLIEQEELKLRWLLWASHPCSGKYGDDGELQCGCFLPTIDFKRDSAEEIERKVPLHNQQRLKPIPKSLRIDSPILIEPDMEL